MGYSKGVWGKRRWGEMGYSKEVCSKTRWGKMGYSKLLGGTVWYLGCRASHAAQLNAWLERMNSRPHL